MDASMVAMLGTLAAGALWAIAAGEMGLGNRRLLLWFDVAAIGSALVAFGALVVDVVQHAAATGEQRVDRSMSFAFWGMVVGLGLALRYVTRFWEWIGGDAAWRTFGIAMLVPAFAVTGCAGGCGVDMLAGR